MWRAKHHRQKQRMGAKSCSVAMSRRDEKQFSPALHRWVTDPLNLNQSRGKAQSRENVFRIEFDSELLQTKAKLGFKRSLRVMFPLLPNVAVYVGCV